MQLKLGPYDLVDVADRDQRHTAPPAVDGDQMHAVERLINRSRDPAFDAHPPANQIAHQAAHR